MMHDPSSFAPERPQPGEAPEHRRWPRRTAGKVRAVLVPEPEPAPRFIAVGDVSAGGIRLGLDCPFGVGTALGLRLQRPGRARVLRVSGTVVFVLEALKGLFITGCAFDRLLTDDDLRGLL